MVFFVVIRGQVVRKIILMFFITIFFMLASLLWRFFSIFVWGERSGGGKVVLLAQVCAILSCLFEYHLLLPERKIQEHCLVSEHDSGCTHQDKLFAQSRQN